MFIRPRLACAAALASAWFVTAPAAHAVIVDGANGTGTANTTAPFPVAGLNNVGVVNFNPPSSAVYIGNGWALTAAHIGPAANFPGSTFTVGGSTFAIDAYHQFTNPSDSSATDLAAFHLSTSPSLPRLAFPIAAPALGTFIYSMGDGLTRSAAMTTVTGGYTAYTESTPNVLRYGTNPTTAPPGAVGATTVINAGFGNTTVFASTFGASNPANPSSSLISAGDSGGGVFGANNVLLGINDVQFNFANQQANTAAYGNQSGYVDIATYESQIAATTGVPEPASTAVLAAGAGLLLLRRRRARQA